MDELVKVEQDVPAQSAPESESTLWEKVKEAKKEARRLS